MDALSEHVDSRMDDLKAYLDDKFRAIQTVTADHETRIRAIEKARERMYLIDRALIAIAGIVGLGGLGFLWAVINHSIMLTFK